MLANAVGTDAHGTRSTAVLRRFSGPARRPAFWAALGRRTVAAELVALASIVFADEPVPGYRALFRLIGGAVRGLRADRLAPAPGQLHRAADGRDGLRAAGRAGVRAGRLADAAAVRRPARGRLGDPDDRAAAELPERRAGSRAAGRLGSLVGATCCSRSSSSRAISSSSARGTSCCCTPTPGIADAVRRDLQPVDVFACLGTAVGDRRPLHARVAAAAAGDAAERRRHLVPALLRGRQRGELESRSRGSRSPRCWSSRLAFLAGLLRSRLARGGVADLFGEIRTMRGPQLQERLAKAAGDQSLVVAYRHADAYADAGGAPVADAAGGRSRLHGARRRRARVRRRARRGPRAGRGRRRGRGDRARARPARRDESRATRSERLVAAGDAERRRLERDLHDGAQQRLVAVALQLRLLQADIRRDPAAAEALVTTASDELARSLAELRELARGIHPAVLEHGLATALSRWRRGRPSRPRCPARRASCPGGRARAVLRRLRGAGERRQVRAGDGRFDLAHPHARELAIEIADDGIGGAEARPAPACAACRTASRRSRAACAS